MPPGCRQAVSCVEGHPLSSSCSSLAGLSPFHHKHDATQQSTALLSPCPFCHNTTLEHYPLPSIRGIHQALHFTILTRPGSLFWLQPNQEPEKGRDQNGGSSGKHRLDATLRIVPMPLSALLASSGRPRRRLNAIRDKLAASITSTRPAHRRKLISWQCT